MDFRVLGPLEVVDEDRPVPLGRGKHRAVLAVLLLHAGEVVPTDHLVEALWGAAPPPTAAKIVRNYVSVLRKALGPDQHLLETRAPGYRMMLDGASLDLVRFEELAVEGRRALEQEDATRAAELLRRGLDLWRGPALAEFAYEDFAQREIGRLEELRLSAIEDRIEADLRLGRHAAVVPELESLVSEHPLRERFREQLMLALYRSGRQADALATYQDARRMLIAELGLEPGPSLQELERKILAQDSDLDAPVAAPTMPPSARRRGVLLIALGAACLVVAAVAVALVEVRGGGSAGLASVAANSLARIDPRTNRVTAEIPVGARPAGLTSGFGSLWVANLDDATVQRVDTAHGRVVRAIPTAASPTGVAAGAGAVWAVGTDGIVHRIDPHFDAVTRNVTTFKPGSLLTAGLAAGAVAVRRGAVWVLTGGYGATPYLSRIRRNGRKLEKLPIGNAPTALATGFGSLWITDGFDNTVTRIDSNDVVLASIPAGGIGSGPSAIAAGAGAVWAAESSDDAVVRIDPRTNAVVTTIPVGRHPSALAVGAGAVWVADAHDGTVSRIDPRTNRVVERISLGSSPAGIAVVDGAVWVTTQELPRIPAVAPGGTLRIDYVGPNGDPSMDPAQYDDRGVSYATCAKLLNYPDSPAPSGARLVAEVAHSLPAVSADGRTYTFTIRRGFRFSPPLGTPVTAAAFKQGIERSLSPKAGALAAAFVDGIAGEDAYLRGKARHIAGLAANGDKLTIRLVRRDPSFPAKIAMPFFCAVPENTPIDRRGVPVLPSAGPYYVASYVPHRQLVLKRNPNYGGRRPHKLETIVYTLGVKPGDAVMHVEAGQADYAANYIPIETDARLAARYGAASPAAARGGQRYFLDPRLAIAFLALNTSRPLFANERLRRAVNYAIDRRALARLGSLIAGPGAFTTIATDQYLPPTLPAFERGHVYPLSGDAAAARRNAGPLAATAVMYTCNQTPCPELTHQIAQDLAKIGIRLDVKEFPRDEMFERASRPGEPYDILLADWGADYADPSDFLNVLLDERGNLSHFRSKVWAGRLDRVAQLEGPARDRAYGKLALDLARDAAPFVVYADGVSRDFFSARVGCQVFNPVYGVDVAGLCLRHSPPA